MSTSEITSSHDLGEGWSISFVQDSSDQQTATVRNCDKGLRIDLSADSLNTLRKILAKNYRA